MMLDTAPIVTMLPVIDLQRARQFYEHTLGLKPLGQKPNGQFLFSCGNGAQTIALFPRSGGTKAEHTALGFEVHDIEQTIQELESHGVVFEDYDTPELKTDSHHVCVLGAEKAAWFKDTEGNFLCVHEEVH